MTSSPKRATYRLGRISGFRMSAGLFGVILLSLAWLVQLPVIHQIHLVFDHTEHVWCPVHHRLEHVKEPAQARLGRSFANRKIRLIDASEKSKSGHDACALSLMHQSLSPLVQHALIHAVPSCTCGNRSESILCAQNEVLSYSPKHSPPLA